MLYIVEELITEDGKSPFAKWVDSLSPEIAKRITSALYRMELGNLSNVKMFDGIGEYKINTGPGYRIYLAKDGEKIIVLLGGGKKDSQQKDIASAKALWEDYKARKKSGKSKE